jgi:hypothetical protein
MTRAQRKKKSGRLASGYVAFKRIRQAGIRPFSLEAAGLPERHQA